MQNQQGETPEAYRRDHLLAELDMEWLAHFAHIEVVPKDADDDFARGMIRDVLQDDRRQIEQRDPSHHIFTRQADDDLGRKVSVVFVYRR